MHIQIICYLAEHNDMLDVMILFFDPGEQIVWQSLIGTLGKEEGGILKAIFSSSNYNTHRFLQIIYLLAFAQVHGLWWWWSGRRESNVSEK